MPSCRLQTGEQRVSSPRPHHRTRRFTKGDMGMLKRHRQHGSRRAWGAVTTVILMGSVLSCDQEALVKIAVTADVGFSDVVLRLSAKRGEVQQSIPDATFGPATVFK